MPSAIAIYIRPDLETAFGLDKCDTAYISVTKIINSAGRYSGLVIEIEKFLSCPQWRRAFVKLTKDGPHGWFMMEKF